MNRVFELYVAEENQKRSASLTLPASLYELVDMLERLGSEDIDSLYFEVEEYHRGEALAPMMDKKITIRELNILAWKIAGMDEGQEAILEGLVRMERKEQGTDCLPYPKLLQLAENTDCCHWVPQARNDSQLGRFYGENGFVEGLEDLSDNIFEMLDFEKIGREARLAEDGVFTSAGYVVRHDKLRELEKLPNLDFIKPFYTIQLEIRKAGEENGPWLNIELPLLRDKIKELQEKYPRGEYQYTCIDCVVPFFREQINSGNAELRDISRLAAGLDHVQESGQMAKYKALLLATGCQDMEQAVELCRSRVLAEYKFFFPQKVADPNDYAADWLQKKLGKDARLIPSHGLEKLGQRLMERNNVVATDYGLIQRRDGQPIQRLDQEQTLGFQMGGMGGM